MQTQQSPKFGKLALVAENDGCNWSLKASLLHYLYHQLAANWQLDVLLINTGRDISPWIEQLSAQVFNIEKIPAVKMEWNPSTLIQDAHLFAQEFWKASPVYFHIRRSSYDGFVFIGLSLSITSLLPVTKRRNCLIPLLFPTSQHTFNNHLALQNSLLCCDYFFCHSEKEAEILRRLQPHAEIRVFPLLVDLDFARKFLPGDSEWSPPKDFVLAMGEEDNASLDYFSRRLMEKGIPVVKALDRCAQGGRKDGCQRIHTSQLLLHFEEVIENIRGLLLFQGENFLPLFYNFCQAHTLIYLSRHYAWHELLDGDGVGLLSFDKDPDLKAEAFSFRCLPAGYHHYRYFTNYLLRFLNEWSIDNMIRNSGLAPPFPS